MQNCPPCCCPTITADISRPAEATRGITTEWSAQSEHANASAAEFVSLCYNYVRCVTVRPPCYPDVRLMIVTVSFSDFIHIYN